jgi:hypothetical protein
LLFSIVGVDASQNRACVEMTITLLDENGKEISCEPICTTLKKEWRYAMEKGMTLDGFSGHLQTPTVSPGKYRIRLAIADKISNKTAVKEIPFWVFSPQEPEMKIGNLSEPLQQLPTALYCTYGQFGSIRPADVIAGESLHLYAIIRDIEADADGYAELSAQSDVTDPSEKTIIHHDPSRSSGRLWDANSPVVHYERIDFARDSEPGIYEYHLKVWDSNAVEKENRSIKINVHSASTFGLINMQFAQDSGGKCPLSNIFYAGISPYLQYSIVGANVSQNRLCVENTITILDENGKDISIEPLCFALESQSLDTEGKRIGADRLPVYFQVVTNTPGKYRVHIELEDKISNKTASYEIPFYVLPADLGMKKLTANTKDTDFGQNGGEKQE